WQALHGALIGCLALLRRKSNHGTVADTEAVALARSYLENIQVSSLGKDDRKLCFEVLECLLECYPDSIATLGEDLIVGICAAIDTEKDPQCLMLTFHIVEILPRVFPDPFGQLDAFAEEVFDRLSCYFPIHFTHTPNDDFDVKKNDLSRALMLAFSSTPSFEPFAIPLLLEKLSSSLSSAKVDSLKYLSNCLVSYGDKRMEKHVKSIWSSLKDAIFTSSQESISQMVSELSDDTRFQDNEIAKEALTCLRKFMMQDSGLLLSLILEDEDLERILRSITSTKNYNELPVESKQKLHSFGRILSVSIKVSTSSCYRVLQHLFPRLMDICEISLKSCRTEKDVNYGALYLCIELLDACRGLALGSEELFPEDTWCGLLQQYSDPLTNVLHSILVTSTSEHAVEAYILCGVKGLVTLATFPRGFLSLPESLFENILTVFMLTMSSSCEDTFFWKLTLKALVQIGSFIEKYQESEKAESFMVIVVEAILSFISLDNSSMPLRLQLEAVSSIAAVGRNFMLRVIQGLEGAISANFFEAFAKANPNSVQSLGLLLECFDNKALPWIQSNINGEDAILRFADNIWCQIESFTTFDICTEGKEVLDKMMATMRLIVAGCSEDNQGVILQKAYGVLSSSTLFPTKESMSKNEIELTMGSNSFLCRDEWLISMFASVVVALRPQTHFPNVKVVLKMLVTSLLRGHLPSAQALGSVMNKLPLMSNDWEESSSCTVEDAMGIIVKTGLWSNDEDIFKLCVNIDSNRFVESNAMVGLAWIGKGLLMRGHDNVKEITLIFLRCLMSGNNMMGLAADAFHVLLSDSHTCLNKTLHATTKPLYKQRFFSTILPFFQSSIKETESSTTRPLGDASVYWYSFDVNWMCMLYRAFGHVVSNVPIAAVSTDAKKLLLMLVDGIFMLSVDVLDKDLTYSLLLVLSGILMDENGREVIVENAHIITNLLAGLISYPHMMVVRETAIQCLIAVTGLPHMRIYPVRMQVLQGLSKAIDDPKRTVRHEAVRCRQAWLELFVCVTVISIIDVLYPEIFAYL
ncbi:hypothetical protein GIB67_027916, partial [Kingdonia uniflora]